MLKSTGAMGFATFLSRLLGMARETVYASFMGAGPIAGAFKMALKKVNGRWYMYMGHLWHFGWSIVDVTDPRDPKFVKFIPGADNTWNIQVTLHDNLMLTALQKSTPIWGGDPTKPQDEGVLIWDLSDPINPTQLAHWKTGASGTHRNSYPGGRYAYLSAAAPGFTGNILLILDVSDPRQPKEAGRWWMPGQKQGEPKRGGPEGFHGPANISPDGKMACAGGDQSRHQRRRQSEADRPPRFQPAFRRCRRADAAQRAAAVGSQPALGEFRIKRRALQ